MPSSKIRVVVGNPADSLGTLEFAIPFRIGRADDCEVSIKDDYVSRVHVDVLFDNGQWWVRDQRSANGLFLNGQRIESTPITGQLEIQLGIAGPVVKLIEIAPPPARPAGDVAHFMEHYFGGADSGTPAGEHTVLVRRAFREVQTRQRSRYMWLLGLLGACALGAGGYAVFLHRQVAQQRAVAQDIFYEMKSIDVDLAGVEKLVYDSGSSKWTAQVRRYQDRRRKARENYDRYLAALKIYTGKMSEQERLIYRITRVFGECELAMPPGFVKEVESYIKKWQSTGRYRKAVSVARENGYSARIVRELLAQDLPPQFFYLAMQESGFDAKISGRMTRKGIAKGMWQFIPETGLAYGLKIGPLADFPRFDPQDERQRYEPASKAAARYLKDLYATDAQASGFLVMACYNWGEDQVLPLVRSLPENPRERNFWQLLAKHRNKLPMETYDYVFYIISAAVIGENPRSFGFDFDNPLEHLDSM